MLDLNLQHGLVCWAKSKPTIKAMYVFGSRAKNTQRPDSDLDLAFEFVDTVDDPLAEIIYNAREWRVELSELSGVVVKDLHLVSDEVVGPERVKIFCR